VPIAAVNLKDLTVPIATVNLKDAIRELKILYVLRESVLIQVCTVRIFRIRKNTVRTGREFRTTL
jgi:hypothetical protein